MCAAPSFPMGPRSKSTWCWRSLDRSAISNGWKEQDWPRASGALPAMPAAAPSTSTEWSPTIYSSQAISHVPPTCFSNTSFSRWSTGTMRSSGPRSRRTIWSAWRPTASRTSRCQCSGRASLASRSRASVSPPSATRCPVGRQSGEPVRPCCAVRGGCRAGRSATPKGRSRRRRRSIAGGRPIGPLRCTPSARGRAVARWKLLLGRGRGGVRGLRAGVVARRSGRTAARP